MGRSDEVCDRMFLRVFRHRIARGVLRLASEPVRPERFFEGPDHRRNPFGRHAEVLGVGACFLGPVFDVVAAS